MMKTMRLGAVLVICVGCYAPQPQPGAPCPDGVCPAGLVCSPATATCERQAIDARSNDSPLHDAAGDASPSDAAPTTPMLVQQVKAYADAAPMLSATLAAPVAGHVLVMIGGGTQSQLATVTGGGATWTRVASSPINTNVEIWFGVTDGSNATVTISIPNSAQPMFMVVSEWSGLAIANTLDVAHAVDGTMSPASAGSITTHARDLVLFGVSAYAPETLGTPAPGTWTPLMSITSLVIVQSAWYQIAAAGTYAPQVTTTGTPWDAAIAALRVAP